MNAEPVSYPMTSEGAFPTTTVIPGAMMSGPPIIMPTPYSPQGFPAQGIPPQNIAPPNGGTLPPPTNPVPNKMPPSGGGGAGIKENPGKEFELEKRTGPALAVPVSGER